MTGLEEVVAAWRRCVERGDPAVLATVVQVSGSAYRRPGARMLFPASGEPTGFVSGGCLEGDLSVRAREVLRAGEARTVVYDMRSPDDIVWGLGLGCNGEIRVLLERLDPARSVPQLEFAYRCLERRRPGAIATVFAAADGGSVRTGQRLTLDADGTLAGELGDDALQGAVAARSRQVLEAGRSRVVELQSAPGAVGVFIEYLAPPLALLVFGAGSDARPVVAQARSLGWRVTLLDHREAYATRQRFPEAHEIRLLDYDRLDPASWGLDERTALLLVTHHFLHDLALLEALLPTATPYIGLLGPRQRGLNLIDELKKKGIEPSPERLRRLYGPVGLDIGSETAEEIALSALAEIQAVLNGRAGGFLRERHAPLHDWG